MIDKINGRTPEDIKKGLKCISENVHCIVPCAYSEEPFPCAEHILRDIKDYIQLLEAAQPKWISVEDELPERWRENDKEQTLINYQIYSPEYGVDVGNYLEPAGVWVIMGLPVKVTHWMSLPEPPRSGVPLTIWGGKP